MAESVREPDSWWLREEPQEAARQGQHLLCVLLLSSALAPGTLESVGAPPLPLTLAALHAFPEEVVVCSRSAFLVHRGTEEMELCFLPRLFLSPAEDRRET